MKRLSSAERERIYKLYALVGYCERIQDEIDEDSAQKLSLISNQIKEVLNMWLDGVPRDTMIGLSRYMTHHQLAVIPRGIRHEKTYIVTETDICELMKDIDFGCRLCLKNLLSVKRCKRRKILERMGFEGVGCILGYCDFELGLKELKEDG